MQSDCISYALRIMQECITTSWCVVFSHYWILILLNRAANDSSPRRPMCPTRSLHLHTTSGFNYTR